ncbi:helix-turn-helix domain-containing protein [Halobacillus massiliensis]|uniref:helix-turn-helix domain-containing protein n=1 Tax=Halobacillus massiliensis TaxID=1926286 RepID=UPI0009E65D31|nr:helix-turn-helix domain-containing protein [Halobacillus massiliensis]
MTQTNELGIQLKAWMKERSLSMREFSRRSDIDPGTVSKIINGKRKATPRHLEKFSKILGVSITELYKKADYPVAEEEPQQEDLYQSVESIQSMLKATDTYHGSFSIERIKEELETYEQYAGTEEGKTSILQNFKNKINNVGSAAGPFIHQLQQMYETFQSGKKGGRELAAIGAVLLYFITAVDVIPDYLFPIGYLDDAMAVKLYYSFMTKT